VHPPGLYLAEDRPRCRFSCRQKFILLIPVHRLFLIESCQCKINACGCRRCVALVIARQRGERKKHGREGGGEKAESGVETMLVVVCRFGPFVQVLDAHLLLAPLLPVPVFFFHCSIATCIVSAFITLRKLRLFNSLSLSSHLSFPIKSIHDIRTSPLLPCFSQKSPSIQLFTPLHPL
jgi:hypothetical protein